MRTIVELPDSQLESLSVLCRKQRISRAEANRRAVDKLLDEQKPMGNAMAGAFGIWKDRAGQVRELREQLRGFGQKMKPILAIISLVLAGSACGQAVDRCPVCRAEVVDITTQKDDESKPSRNIRVWNRSICGNLFFGKGSLICPRDGYAYEAQLKHWVLSLEDRDSFAHPLARGIHGFPLPDTKTIKSRAVFSQEFSAIETVKHGLLFWTMLDERYFTKIRQYAKVNRIVLEIEPHKDRGEAVIRASLTTKTEGAARQPATRPESKPEGGQKPQPKAEGRSR